MVPNLLFILTLGVHYDFGKHLGQDVFKQLRSELEAGPDVTLFQDLQHVACYTSFASIEGQDATSTERRLTVELVFSLEVSVVKDLHGNFLLVVVLGLEVRIIGGDKFLDVNRRDGDLLVLPLAIDAHDNPISNGQGHSENDNEEDVRLEPAVRNDGQDTFQHPRDAEDDGG